MLLGEGRFTFAIELGPRHREPLTKAELVTSDTWDGRFSTSYSLAVEELCGAEYGERQYPATWSNSTECRSPVGKRWGSHSTALRQFSLR